jgi:hypothetical protein
MESTMKKLKTLAVFFCVSVLAGAPSAFAHGEDKPGPHGGVIRMPGAFHTEVVARGNNAIDVYLLDFNWKNPIIKDSSVSVHHVDGERRTELKCKPLETLFSCLAESVALRSGSLRVKASHLGMQGIEVTYPLPLRVGSNGDVHHMGH